MKPWRQLYYSSRTNINSSNKDVNASFCTHYRLQKQNKSMVLAKTVQNHRGALGTFQQFRCTCQVLKFASSTNQDIVKLERSHVLCTVSVLLVFFSCLLVERGSGRDQQCGTVTYTSYSCFQTSIGNCRLSYFFFSDYLFPFSEVPFLNICLSC